MSDETAVRRPGRLGRGLSSLLKNGSLPTSASNASGSTTNPDSGGATISPDHDESLAPASIAPTYSKTDRPPISAQATGDGHSIMTISLRAIAPNPNQPRKQFAPDSLQKLADSIKADGLIQPVVVRRRHLPHANQPTPSDVSIGQAGTPEATEMFELVAGERRWRAAELAGLTALPAIVRELTDRQSTEWALIENLQREDLNPMDRAEAFARLIDRFELSHDEVAARVSMDRSTVSNLLRLLALHRDVQDLVRNGLLSAGQARAIAGLPDLAAQRELAIQAVKEGWSVRRVEAAARAAGEGGSAAAGEGRLPSPRAALAADISRQITEQLGMRSRVAQGKKKGAGTLTIEFASHEQFDDLLGRLGVKLEG